MTNYSFKNEEVNQVNKLLNAIAGQKFSTYRYYGLTKDDVVSELWVKVMEHVNEVQKVELGYIAKICYGSIVDIIRREHARLHVSIDPSTMDYTGTIDDESEFNACKSREITGFDMCVIEDIRNLFPEGTRERTYLDYIIRLEALPDSKLKEFPGMDDTNRKNESYPIEQFLAKKCGYPYSGSSGYRLMKDRVKAKLREHGYID